MVELLANSVRIAAIAAKMMTSMTTGRSFILVNMFPRYSESPEVYGRERKKMIIETKKKIKKREKVMMCRRKMKTKMRLKINREEKENLE